jgi:DNA-binding transcriptional regulator YdaS (Cro superfamily)
MNIHSKAIDLLGGPTEAAKRLSAHFPDKKPLTSAVVWNWRSRGIPVEYSILIERETNGAVMRHELHPEIYPPEEYEKIAGPAAA